MYEYDVEIFTSWGQVRVMIAGRDRACFSRAGVGTALTFGQRSERPGRCGYDYQEGGKWKWNPYTCTG